MRPRRGGPPPITIQYIPVLNKGLSTRITYPTPFQPCRPGGPDAKKILTEGPRDRSAHHSPHLQLRTIAADGARTIADPILRMKYNLGIFYPE